MRCQIIILLVVGLAITPFREIPARGDDGEQNPAAPAPLQAFDPAAAIAALTAAVTDQNAPAGPSMGLATPITVDPLLGSATTSIPIDLPPGRKLTPDLTIRYSSNGGNGMFGVGWNLPLGSIQRNTAHGVPARDGSGNYLWKDFVLVLHGQSILLDAAVVPAFGCDKAMAARSEEVWLSTCYHAYGNQWVITTKDGMVYTYGGQQQARTGPDISSEGGTLAWYLTGVESPEGNTLQIAYRWFPMLSWGYDGLAYPDHIDYGANANATALATHKFHVAFEYNDPAQNPRPDVITSYRAGFPQGASRRVTAIDVWVDGISTQATPTRRYNFSYTQDSDTLLSLLHSVSEQLPADTTNTVPPPPTTFTYQASSRALTPGSPTAALPLTFDAMPHCYSGTEFNGFLGSVSSVGLGGPAEGFLDVDGDGLPDYLNGYGPQVPPENASMELYHNRGGSFEKDPGPAGNGIWTLLLASGALPSIAGVAYLNDMDGDSVADIFRYPDCDCAMCNRPDCDCTVCGSPPDWNFHRNTGASFAAGTPWTRSSALYCSRPTYSALEACTRLVDLNGDGLPDILNCDIDTSGNGPFNCTFYRNTGSAFAAGISWTVPATSDLVNYPAFPSQHGCTNNCNNLLTAHASTYTVIKEVVDMNGDGLPDLVSSRPYECRNGEPCAAGSNCREGICAPASGHWHVWFNTGSGFAPEPMAWPAPAQRDIRTNQYYSPGYPQLDYTATNQGLRDMNGDGLPDYVDFSASPWIVFLNTGAGFRSPGVSWAGTQGLGAIGKTAGGMVDDDVLDVNGDGLGDYVSDHVYDDDWDKNVLFRARLGVAPGGRANLLIHEDNGLGASWEVRYVPSADPATAGSGCDGGTNDGAPCMRDAECPLATCASACPHCSHLPFPVWVVQSLTAHSGLPGPGNDLTTTYTFTGGYFDAAARQFRGFRQSLERRAADGRTIRRQFAAPPFATSTSPGWPSPVPSRPFKLIGRQVLDSNGTKLSETQIDWAVTTLAGGRVQVHPSQRTDMTYGAGGASPQTRRHVFSNYDSYNSVTVESVGGDRIDGSIVMSTTYAAPEPCHGQPTRITVAAPPALPLSQQEFVYDAHCRLTSFGARLALSGQNAATGRPITTAVEYDSNVDAGAAAGQPTRIIDPKGNATTITYDSYALYPNAITNALRQVTSKTYDLQWGKITQLTEPNTSRTTFAYDGLGRLTSIVRPLDSAPWRKFAYAFADPAATPATPSRIDTSAREPNSADGYRLISTFYDALGRKLETKQAQYVQGAAQGVVRDAVAFDSAGRVGKAFAPFQSPGGPTDDALQSYDAPPAGAAGTAFGYDALDRTIRVTNPDGHYRTMDHSVAGQITTLDENYTSGIAGSRVVEYHDALGRVTSKQVHAEVSPSPVQQTDTRYDGLSRRYQVTVTDWTKTPPVSATSTFTYDSLSRRTNLNDPDSGAWNYGYDEAGNLVYQDDPKSGQHLEFCYDGLNRISRKLYFGSADSPSDAGTHSSLCNSQLTPPVPHITYLYDAQGSYGCNSVDTGSLCAVEEHVEDLTSTRRYKRDLRGMVRADNVTQSVSVGGIPHTSSFGQTYGYDYSDRLKSVTYPVTNGNETLYYYYNDLGQLGSVTSTQTYASSVRYDSFGRVTQWVAGNGVTSTATFGEASIDFRLQQLQVTTSGGTVLQRFDYFGNGGAGYDAMGNLKGLTDNSPTGATLKNAWAYGYDGLGRLTSAKLNTSAPVVFSYDGLGNMTSYGSLTFRADATKPHHILQSSIPGASQPYQYEDNGGLASRPDTDLGGGDTARTVTYDLDGRVRTVSTAGGHTVRSVYNYRGERVARIVDESMLTVSFGRWFDVTGGTLVRHLYLGDRLIADSPVTAAAGMAALPESERSILLARAVSEAVAARPALYPVIAFSGMGAAAVGGGVLLLGTVLAFAPGRVRLAYFGKVRRGRVAMVVVLFAVALSPLPLARPAWGGGGGGGGSPPPPTYPVYFIHSDHLGSTMMLSCYMMDNVSGCRGGTVVRYYRYDAYGQPRAYGASGQAIMLGTALLGNWGSYYIPEHLYTGQRWDWQAQVYDYGARFYDPKIANFLTADPAHQGVNPYAYVAWNPVRFTDPTGMFFGTGGDLSLATFAESIMGNPQALGFEQLCALRGLSANVGAPLGGAMGAPLGGTGVAGGLAALASAMAGIAAAIQTAAGAAGDSRLVSAIGEAILGVGGYLGAMLRGDVLDLGGGIYGTVSGIIKGVGEIGLGIAKLDSTMFKQGAGNLGAALVMPRLNNHGGLNWPGTVDNSPASPFPSSGTKVENASIAHDIDVKRSGFLHSAAAEFRWIANSWSGSGTEPGPYGQAYRLLGTVGFGVAGSVLLPFQ